MHTGNHDILLKNLLSAGMCRICSRDSTWLIGSWFTMLILSGLLLCLSSMGFISKCDLEYNTMPLDGVSTFIMLHFNSYNVLWCASCFCMQRVNLVRLWQIDCSSYINLKKYQIYHQWYLQSIILRNAFSSSWYCHISYDTYMYECISVCACKADLFQYNAISLLGMVFVDRTEALHYYLGLYSLRRRRLISIGIPIINLRRSTGIPIPVSRRLLSD